MTDNVPVRTEDGQFVKGKSGNPAGRPRKAHLAAIKQDLEIAVREHLSVERVKRIVNRMAQMAEDGNVAAAKLLLDKVISNARDSEDAQEGGQQVVFRIENVTVAAQREQQQSVQVIDAQVEEIK
jgi:hypothetical protein